MERRGALLCACLLLQNGPHGILAGAAAGVAGSLRVGSEAGVANPAAASAVLVKDNGLKPTQHAPAMSGDLRQKVMHWYTLHWAASAAGLLVVLIPLWMMHGGGAPPFLQTND